MAAQDRIIHKPRVGSGGVFEMSDREILYRLVGDVAGLKRDAQNQAESSRDAWEKIDNIRDMLSIIVVKLDKIADKDADHEKRITKTEDGVSDYHKTKAKLLSVVSGIGIGAGGFGGALGAMMAKWFGGPGV